MKHIYIYILHNDNLEETDKIILNENKVAYPVVKANINQLSYILC